MNFRMVKERVQFQTAQEHQRRSVGSKSSEQREMEGKEKGKALGEVEQNLQVGGEDASCVWMVGERKTFWLKKSVSCWDPPRDVFS